ncbi:MAG: ROK family protein [Bryobacteraceae bacterium]
MSVKTLCVDIGGTGIKAMVVDEAAQPLTERFREDTPHPATLEAVVATIERLARAAGEFDRGSVGFPGVIVNGVVKTAPNLGEGWAGFDIDTELERRLGKSIRCANDAAVQGLGAVSGKGLEMMITLGTGVGCALYHDGRLVNSLEMAHHPFRKGKTYEEWLGNAARKKIGNKKWNKLVREALHNWEALVNFDRLYLGGGNSEKIDFELPPNVVVSSNMEGMLGGVQLWNPANERRSGRPKDSEEPK